MFNTLIEAQVVIRHLSDPDWIIVDCQYDLMDRNAGRERYLAGHIPGAVYACLNQDLSSSQPVTDCGRHPVPSTESLEETFSALGIANHKQVVAYDRSGGTFAARLWWLLNHASHSRVAVLDGGLNAWEQAGYALQTDVPRAVSADFKAVRNPGRLVRLNEVERVPRLIDSREPERYTGKIEPIDPVAGHIPGAVNRFWKDNLDAGGRFLPAASLRRAFHEIYAGVDPEQVTFYCGSGVSACHNLLAAVHAGYPLPRLYAGSWSEWCVEKLGAGQGRGKTT